MRKPNVSSSDLEAAGALARALSRGQSGPARDEKAAAAYVRFPSPAFVRPPAEREASEGGPKPPAAPVVLDSWEVFLAWSLELTRAHAGFVVDSQGFVIASRGNIPKDGFEGIGAELCYAMDQLDRIHPEAGRLRLLELQLEASRLIAVRVAAGDLGTILIGFQGTRSLSDDIRDSLVRQLKSSLDTMT